jgi:hypothetical protein
MIPQWKYQIRIDLKGTLAEAARRDPQVPALRPLLDVLKRHGATMKCQFDAFADYVAEAGRHGGEHDPLYKWTKAVIEDPAKKERYLKSFTIYAGGEEVYAKETADSLEADLQPLARAGLLTRVSKHDTNPANNPQPPERFRSQAGDKAV